MIPQTLLRSFLFYLGQTADDATKRSDKNNRRSNLLGRRLPQTFPVNIPFTLPFPLTSTALRQLVYLFFSCRRQETHKHTCKQGQTKWNQNIERTAHELPKRRDCRDLAMRLPWALRWLLPPSKLIVIYFMVFSGATIIVAVYMRAFQGASITHLKVFPRVYISIPPKRDLNDIFFPSKIKNCRTLP